MTSELKHSDSLGQLDLSKKGTELEKIFDSVINKIPDLCPPPSYRWAGENDFFNKTKDLKLVPFLRDQTFDRVVHRCSQSDDPPHLKRGQSNINEKRSSMPRSESSTPRSVSSCEFRHKQLDRSEDNVARPTSSLGFRTSRATTLTPIQRSKSSMSFSGSSYRTDSGVEKREQQKETRKRIYNHYSGIKIKARSKSRAEQSIEQSYDCLFTDWSTTKQYPFANPIPRGMLASDNVDNLRNIIVSVNDVEWKMLTPVRPTSEYEEKYFDRLIQLHRCRYQLQQMELGRDAIKPAFKHKRHRLLIRYDGGVIDAVGFKKKDRQQCVKCVGDDSVTVCAGVKWRRRMRVYEREQERMRRISTKSLTGGFDASKAAIPIVTLTSADEIGSSDSRPIMCATDKSSSSSSSSSSSE